ncbi:MAG: glycerate kinase [Cyanobacteriota bacterium]|nr:glycerate kinase [Cyanobacteriota bacterium]
MRLLLAPDAFKGCLSAAAVCRALEEGLRRVVPEARIRSIPLADGGEGTVDALVAATGGWFQSVSVTGPLPGEKARVEARLGWLDPTTAVVEMASASGLPLVSPERRNPLHTTSQGTGELIAAALDAGARHLIVGLGGSATNDLGAGMAQALGMRFLDRAGRLITAPLSGGRLREVAAVDGAGVHPGLASCRLEVASDVDNPLLGPLGATAVYGPQKGATAAEVAALEAGLAHLIGLVEDATGRRVRDQPGAGAAGGMGAMLCALGSEPPRPGIELVLAASGFAAALAEADLVLTGEGRVDAQTARGKTIRGVARAAAAAGVPVVALAGEIGPGAEAVLSLGVSGLFSLVPGPMDLPAAMARAPELLADAAERVLRLVVALERRDRRRFRVEVPEARPSRASTAPGPGPGRSGP